MKRISTFLLFFSIQLLAFAQPAQNVRGKIVDSETNYPLTGAKVEVLTGDTVKRYRAITDIDGNFLIEKVPVFPPMILRWLQLK